MCASRSSTIPKAIIWVCSGGCLPGGAAPPAGGCGQCRRFSSTAVPGGTVVTSAKTLPLPHGLHGIYISRYARIGADCCIYQNVTIGEVDRAAPQIGDHCLIGAGAVLVGGITVGHYAKIGAGAVVCFDVPAHATVVAQQPRVIVREEEP